MSENSVFCPLKGREIHPKHAANLYDMNKSECRATCPRREECACLADFTAHTQEIVLRRAWCEKRASYADPRCMECGGEKNLCGIKK